MSDIEIIATRRGKWIGAGLMLVFIFLVLKAVATSEFSYWWLTVFGMITLGVCAILETHKIVLNIEPKKSTNEVDTQATSCESEQTDLHRRRQH